MIDAAAQVEIRLLSEADIPSALRLKELANWNQTEPDWRRLWRLEPSGCFAAVAGSRLVGTITTTAYGTELAWIGMVLVDPEYRRRGIATRLMTQALDHLEKSKVETIGLDATPEGRLVYENLGFRRQSLIERWMGAACERPGTNCEAFKMSEVLDLDREVFEADRSKLMEMLMEDGYVRPLVTRGLDGRVGGYALARKGSNAAYVGPLVATDEQSAAALLDGLLNQMTGQNVYIDLNTLFKDGVDLLRERGFVKQRDLLRMSRGNRNIIPSTSIFAIAGPEVG